MTLFLQLLSGLAWSVTYLMSIRTGLKEKTYAMPVVALALNLSWEGLYTIRDFMLGDVTVQVYVNLAWFLADLVIAYTYVLYGKKDFPAKDKWFFPWSAFLFIMSILLQIVFMQGFGEMIDPLGVKIPAGAVYSAFLQNLVMSFLFITMWFGRGGNRGQNLVIALSKCIGTLAPTILFGIFGSNLIVLVLGVFTFLLDCLYMALLMKGDRIIG